MSLNVIFHKFNYILVRMVSTKEWLHDQQMQQYLVLIQSKVSYLLMNSVSGGKIIFQIWQFHLPIKIPVEMAWN